MMKFHVASAVSATLLAFTVCMSPASAASDAAKIAAAIKANEATLVTAFNSCDAMKGIAFDAPDVVNMFHGAANVAGAAADMAEAKKGCQDKTQHVTVSAETVDVASSGDMAVYHSTYVFSGTDPKTKKAFTEKGNYLTGWKKQADGSWKIEWSIVSNTP